VNLPVSRNTTYGAESPVLSGDLNDLEDCVIGHKHKELEIPLAAGAWQQRAGGVGELGDGQWTFTAGTESLLVANISRPAGSRITKATYVYDRTSTSQITRNLKRRKRDGTGTETIATTTENTSVGWNEHVDVYNHTMDAGYVYWIEIDITVSNATTFEGGAVFVDRL